MNYSQAKEYLKGLGLSEPLQTSINEAVDKAADETKSAEDRWNDGVVPLFDIYDKNTVLTSDVYDAIAIIADAVNAADATDPVRPYPTTRPH